MDEEFQYKEFHKIAEEKRLSLLAAADRFQSISEREDRTVLTVEGIMNYMQGRHFIRHRGCSMLKTVGDQAILKELLAHVKPATVIEIGAYTGGNAVWMADTLELEGIECSLYSLDIDLSLLEEKVKKIKPDNVKFIEGDCFKIEQSFPPEFLESISHPLIVIEDAQPDILNLMEYFIPYLKTGDYFLIEDTNPILPRPLGAGRFADYEPHGTQKLNVLKEFLQKHSRDFKVDSYFTDFFGYNGCWNMHGYIRRM